LPVDTTVLELGPEWVNVLRPLADRPLDSFVKELVVLELYRRHMISSGKAAELLDMERFEFVRYASRLGIPFLDMSADELREELAHLPTFP
jgi:predicted HTH domain antitoxin